MKREQRTNESKTLISEALLYLMSTTSYENINISSICQQATVSRNTFYRNFKNKDSVLNYYLQKKCKYIINQFESNEAYDPLSPTYTDLLRVYRRFYHYWYSNQDLIILLLSHGLQNHLLTALEKAVNNSYTEEWIKVLKEPFSSISDYYYNWLANSLYSILITWAKNKFNLSPTEVADLLIQISTSITARQT